MEARIENTIIKNLIQNDTYTRKVIPFIKSEYFTESSERLVFEEISNYFDKYTKSPTVEALLINLDNVTSKGDAIVKSSKQLVENIKTDDTPLDWLIDETEKWCKDRAIYIAVMDSIEVLDEKSKRSTGEIPDLLKDALSVSFDTHIGHDQLEDADERFEFYNTEEEKMPFDLEYFNKITKGGLPNKTLNICLAGTGVGKSLFMCHMASNCRDYLNMCAAHRIRPRSGANSYTLVKSIAEELRGLAVEYDVPMVSATQTTRSGYGSTDIGLEDTSESFGLPATADLMFALITSDELEDLDQLVVKQLKNRYNDPTIFKRFVMRVDRSRMKLYDVEQEAQEELIDSIDVDDDTPVFDRSEKFRDFKV